MSINRINPASMYHSPVFTQVATVSGPARLVFVGGQNGVTREGKVVGSDISSQTAQAYKNVLTALEAAGATLEDVVKMTIYLVQGQSLQDAYGAVQSVQPQPLPPPPTVSMIMVAGLANPEFLIEIEAVAAVS